MAVKTEGNRPLGRPMYR